MVSVCVFAVCLYYLYTRCKSIASIFLFPARKYDNGEYLNITGITRDQAGDYECSALNDIASPDTKTVKVTVNCKYVLFFFTLAALFSVHMKGTELTPHIAVSCARQQTAINANPQKFKIS